MKTVLASKITKALLLSFLATSFVACKTVEQGSDFSSRAPASTSLVGSAKQSFQQSRSSRPQGPGDSGGGNGVGGKAYESYIVDLEALPEFIEYVAPVLDKMDGPNLNPDEKKSSKVIADAKTWYIAPVKLNPIDKAVLGVSFSKDKTEQLAIQTKNAIWIDQKKWIEMKEPKDRAMLLFHEITMQLYLMQFEDLVSLCSQLQSDCGDASKLVGLKFFQPVPRRALTNDDYDNIRAAAFWMANEAKSATTLQIFQMLGAKKFDQRFYGPEALSEQKENGRPGNFVDYHSADAGTSLSRAQVLNKMPDKCYAVHSKAYFDCAITSTSAKVNGLDEVKISLASKYFSRETVAVSWGGSGQKDLNFNNAFKMSFSSRMSCKVGTVSQMITLYALDDKFNKSSAREVLALTFVPQVVFESNDTGAILGKAKVTSLETDTIIAFRSDMNTDIDYLAQMLTFWEEQTQNSWCQ